MIRKGFIWGAKKVSVELGVLVLLGCLAIHAGAQSQSVCGPTEQVCLLTSSRSIQAGAASSRTITVELNGVVGEPTYEWLLDGSGELKVNTKGTVGKYTSPQIINSLSEEVGISVTVKDNQEQVIAVKPVI